MAPSPSFREPVLARTSEQQARWFSEQLEQIQTTPERSLIRAFVAARRKLGSSAVPHDEVPDLPGTWTVDCLARVALLRDALPALPPEKQRAIVSDLYIRGELEERRAVLRALPYLPNSELHAQLAVEACRTNAKDMFEAIACENPFPAKHFETLPFNQMVLKSLFMDVASERIIGLEQRITPELLRMIDDFDAELTAAGRPLPKGMAWIRARGESK